ncbi:MAG: hypothetical protein UW78_C0022G0008 [Candidatus Azambacteria bacterium GW2011_GWA1_44_9]|uniref:Uncharacterized protein n=1 Tax=Candidatus Azambacteria bacterium GW2011_GWA1_44_9 TaxID=1618610 RepID=A0A0G1MJ92_9BACT|nr:MAG: hypothetical protein UW78_C0022G0008 [Candidatus Azambacteria bacterium GW2011_GWA1_44_9]
MNERFSPNKFERLAQGSDARDAQAREIHGAYRDSLGDEQPVVGYKDSKFVSLFMGRGRFVVPVAIPLLIIASLTSACGDDKSKVSEPRAQEKQLPQETKVLQPESFSDNLPTTLKEVCKLYVSSANLGPQEGEVERRLGNTMIGVYLDANSDDPDARALYLSGLGFLLSLETYDDMELVYSAFNLAVDRGLPEPQEELAIGVVESISRLTEEADIDNEAAILVNRVFDIVDDLDAYVCPEGID